MKTIQPLKRKFYVKARNLLCIVTLILVGVFFTDSGKAQEHYSIEYTDFLTEAENIFLIHPDLVRDVFFGLIHLKGNPGLAKKKITKDVLGCGKTVRGNRGCRIKKLKMEQKKRGLSGFLQIPVNLTFVEATKHTRTKQRIHIRWRPELITPPAISLKEFLDDVWAAKESKYFSMKKGIERIQLNPVLERDIYFITDNSMANSLIGVYKQLHADRQDSITFVFDYAVPTKRHVTMDYFIYLKADKVTMNHHDFYTSERKKHW